jgi:hypothetical protein
MTALLAIPAIFTRRRPPAMVISSPTTVSPPTSFTAAAAALETALAQPRDNRRSEPLAAGGDAELDELLESLQRLERGHRTDVLHCLCTYASEGSAARRHLLARRLRDGLSVLGSGTDDEQALATDLIILLLTNKSACASLAFDAVYVPLFLSMLATMESEERACTQFVKLVRS